MTYTYIVRWRDGSLYTGWTNNLEKRIKDHNSGRGAKYTKSRRPVLLAYYEEFATKEEAMRREWEIKQLKRQEKQDLVERFRPKWPDLYSAVIKVFLPEIRNRHWNQNERISVPVFYFIMPDIFWSGKPACSSMHGSNCLQSGSRRENSPAGWDRKLPRMYLLPGQSSCPSSFS